VCDREQIERTRITGLMPPPPPVAVQLVSRRMGRTHHKRVIIQRAAAFEVAIIHVNKKGFLLHSGGNKRYSFC